MSIFLRELTTQQELYKVMGQSSCIFFTSTSDFCAKAEQQLVRYLETHEKVISPPLRFYKFVVTPENASSVEVIKVPQLRGYLGGKEYICSIGKLTYEQLNNLFRRSC